jgi:hypothetical protein
LEVNVQINKKCSHHFKVERRNVQGLFIKLLNTDSRGAASDIWIIRASLYLETIMMQRKEKKLKTLKTTYVWPDLYKAEDFFKFIKINN